MTIRFILLKIKDNKKSYTPLKCNFLRSWASAINFYDRLLLQIAIPKLLIFVDSLMFLLSSSASFIS